MNIQKRKKKKASVWLYNSRSPSSPLPSPLLTRFLEVLTCRDYSPSWPLSHHILATD